MVCVWEGGNQGFELLCVSQFTLLGILKKPRPDYSRAMPPQEVCGWGVGGVGWGKGGRVRASSGVG